MLNLKNARSKKGFTLMEMLIVVAIIAILVAIAIPTFSNQLNKVKLEADHANMRAAYALVQSAKLLDSDPNGSTEPTADTTVYYYKDGSFGTYDAAKVYTLQGSEDTCSFANIKGKTTGETTEAKPHTKGYVIVATYTLSTDTWVLTAEVAPST